MRGILTLLILALGLMSAGKVNRQLRKEVVGKTWEVVSFVDVATQEKQLVPNNLGLSVKFGKQKSMVVTLERNTCRGTYELTRDKRVKSIQLACTKMCCDGELSKLFLESLHNAQQFGKDRTTDMLVVKGEHTIIQLKVKQE